MGSLWNSKPIPPPPAPEPTAEQVTALALALLKEPANTFQACLDALGENKPALACFAASDWIHRTDVQAEMERLLVEHGPEFFLPTREKIMRDAYELSRDGSKGERLAALRFYAELREFLPKSGPSVGINVSNSIHTDKGVLIISDSGNQEEFEQRMREQQRQLTSVDSRR